ncbi:MAG: polysaccharide export protein [Granulosicoccus sp.]|nr:polysaccharide export protein [Granulosicoccus sp.]
MNILQILVISVSFLALASCGTPAVENPAYALATSGKSVGAASRVNMIPETTIAPYVISAGDKLSIKFYLTPELNEEVQVQPDGLINLRLVGSIRAQGKTPERLVRYLELAYSKELVDPAISVVVQDIRDFQVYVGGEVAQPQAVELLPRMTPLEAIMATGGPTNGANLRHIVLVRKSATGQPVPYEINLQKALKTGNTLQLQPFDIVYVPKSRIARLNLFVENYIGGLLMFRGISAGYDIDDALNR